MPFLTKAYAVGLCLVAILAMLGTMYLIFVSGKHIPIICYPLGVIVVIAALVNVKTLVQMLRTRKEN